MISSASSSLLTAEARAGAICHFDFQPVKGVLSISKLGKQRAKKPGLEEEEMGSADTGSQGHRVWVWAGAKGEGISSLWHAAGHH